MVGLYYKMKTPFFITRFIDLLSPTITNDELAVELVDVVVTLLVVTGAGTSCRTVLVVWVTVTGAGGGGGAIK